MPLALAQLFRALGVVGTDNAPRALHLRRVLVEALEGAGDGLSGKKRASRRRLLPEADFNTAGAGEDGRECVSLPFRTLARWLVAGTLAEGELPRDTLG